MLIHPPRITTEPSLYYIGYIGYHSISLLFYVLFLYGEFFNNKASHIVRLPPAGLPASFFRRQAQVVSPALKRADCLSVASFCPLAGGSTGVAGKTQP